MENSQSILQRFDPISLEAMDSVKLMNRTDTKFLFTAGQFEHILDDIVEHYRILEINGTRSSRYKTLYYDTPNLDLYMAHHKGKLNRYKVRHRTYLETDAGFLEVKFKNNKGRTIKDRVPEKRAPHSWQLNSEQFLRRVTPFDPQLLIPTIWVNYSRLTLVHKSESERVTLDTFLEFEKDGTIRQMPNLVIAEVKQDKKKASYFIQMMKKHRIREGSLSKYCLGVVLTCDGVKKNNFKQKLISLNQILHDTSITNH
jgi:hypothetical protein